MKRPCLYITPPYIFVVIVNTLCRSSLENYTKNNTSTTRRNTSKTRVQHEATRSAAQDSTSTIKRNMNKTRPNTSTKEALAGKLGPYFALFVTEICIFLIFPKIINIVLHVILFKLFEYQGLMIIPPSEILSNQGHMTSCAKLRGLLYRKLKIVIQVPKTYIYPLFCVLSTTALVSKN